MTFRPGNHYFHTSSVHKHWITIFYSNMQYDIDHCLRSLKSTFVVNVFHLSGVILTLKNKFLQENIFSYRKNNFPIGYLKFPIGIKYLYIWIQISMGFEQKSHKILKYVRKSYKNVISFRKTRFLQEIFFSYTKYNYYRIKKNL